MGTPALRLVRPQPHPHDDTDSNTWGGASGHTYTFERQPDGTTGIDVVVVREGKNAKGRVIGALVGVVGNRFLSRQFNKTVNAIEARQAA